MTSNKNRGNYYDILHVSSDAPAEIIRSSYRTLMQRLKNHPDLGGDAATAALINESYAVLKDVRRRAEYDAKMDIAQHLGTPNSTVAKVVRPDTALSGIRTGIPHRLLNPCRECVFCKAPHNHGNIIHADAECSVCRSPLYPAEKHRLESKGKRAIARISEDQDVIFYARWPQRQGYTGRMEDASLNGMRFVTNEALNEGQYIKIVGKFLEAVGDVIHCHENGRRGATVCSVMGISFVTVRFVRSVGAFVSDRV